MYDSKSVSIINSEFDSQNELSVLELLIGDQNNNIFLIIKNNKSLRLKYKRQIKKQNTNSTEMSKTSYLILVRKNRKLYEFQLQLILNYKII